MQSYSMAGDFTTSDRLKSAIRVNFIYYSSIGAIFLVLLTYVVFRDGLDFANLKVIAISSSNTWGLFLLVILLGYGLVELPRSIINRSKFSQSLDQLYFQVAKVNAEKIEVEEKLDDVLEEIQQALSSVGSNESSFLGQYLTKIMDRCPPDWKRRTNALRRQAAASNSINDSDRANLAYDIESLSRLHRKVKKVVNQHRQIICRWNQLIPEVVDWEDVAKNQMENLRVSVSPVFVSSLPREKSIFSHIYTPTVEWYWKCLVRVWLLRIVGTTLAALSIAVVWSEMTFPISIFSTKLSIFAYCVDQFQLSQRYFISEVSIFQFRSFTYNTIPNQDTSAQLFSIFSMGYLAICAFYTVFHMKIFNVYHLAPRKQTEEYSLLFSGMLVCRLSAPLCLNYLCLVHRDSHVIKSNQLLETSFTTIMGHLDLIPILNNGLNIILPLCISAICLAIYFNIGTAILHKIGYEQYIKDDEMTLDWVQTGRDLVKREKAKMLRGYESSGATQQALSIVSGAATNVPKSSKGRAEITPSDKSITAAAGTGTPTSQTSSSSGLSRSSLLPKTNRSDPTVAFNDVNVTSASHISSPQRPDRSDDNIIEIDLGVQKRPPDKSRGFFDDI